jgi:hypothetical protein
MTAACSAEICPVPSAAAVSGSCPRCNVRAVRTRSFGVAGGHSHRRAQPPAGGDEPRVGLRASGTFRVGGGQPPQPLPLGALQQRAQLKPCAATAGSGNAPTSSAASARPQRSAWSAAGEEFIEHMFDNLFQPRG